MIVDLTSPTFFKKHFMMHMCMTHAHVSCHARDIDGNLMHRLHRILSDVFDLEHARESTKNTMQVAKININRDS